MKNGFDIDIDKTFAQFCNLAKEEMTKACKKALVAGAKEIVKQGRSNANAGITSHRDKHWEKHKPVTFIDNITDAIRASKVDAGYGRYADNMSIKVHPLGTKKKGSGTYRYRFLEGGTKPRTIKYYKTKDGKLKLLAEPRTVRGVTPRRWFETAYSSVEPQLENIYLAEIDKTIKKLNAAK